MNAANVAKCDWCHGTGLLTAYHRDYRGSADVIEEHADRRGEIHTRKVPGTIAVHCTCKLGEWMHGQTDAEIRDRIPTMSQVLHGCGRYTLERADADDPDELSPSATAFLRGWKTGLRFPAPPGPTRNDPVEMSNQLRARNERLKAEEVRHEPAPRGEIGAVMMSAAEAAKKARLA